MPPHFCGQLSSEVFKIVANGNREFTVHSDLLLRQSKAAGLRGLTPGSQNEPMARRLDLLEWDGDTVARFVDFLYVGHYQVPSPVSPFITPGSVLSDDDNYQREIYTPETAVSFRTETVRSDDTELAAGPLASLEGYYEELDIGCNTQQARESEKEDLELFNPVRCDYDDVLLAHAKVYALAQAQEVEVLQKLALQRLVTALLSIGPVDPSSPAALNTINMLRYIYSHPVSLEAAREPMRDMVSQFAALNFPALQSKREMVELIREGGQLASDLMEKIRRRLVNSENSLHTLRTELIDSENDLRATREELVGKDNLEEDLRTVRGELVASQDSLHTARAELAEKAGLEETLSTVRGELVASQDSLRTARAELAEKAGLEETLGAVRAELTSSNNKARTERIALEGSLRKLGAELENLKTRAGSIKVSPTRQTNSSNEMKLDENEDNKLEKERRKQRSLAFSAIRRRRRAMEDGSNGIS